MLAAHTAREFVGFGQQTAFGRHSRDLAAQQIALLEMIDDLLAGQPFLDHDRLQDRLALGQRADDIFEAGFLLEHIFAGLDLGRDPVDVNGGHQQDRAVDHAILHQLFDHIGQAALDHHHLVGRQRALRNILFVNRIATGNQQGYGYAHDHRQTGQITQNRQHRAAGFHARFGH